MGSQEERDNFFSLVLLLFRVGNQRLREYFKTQWPIVYRRVKPGTVPPPWQDTPHDATEMKKIQPTKLKFRFKDEVTKFNSGNTNDWDFSLLTTVLRYSSLHFVLPSSPEEKALDDLKKMRNTLIGHTTDVAIPNAVFNTAWTDACKALALFKASAADFKSVQDDVKKPLNVLYAVLQPCVKQEREIQDPVDTVINRLQKLQQTVEKQHATQIEVVRRIETKVDLLLDQGQRGQKRSSTEVHLGKHIQTKKTRTASDNIERDYAEDSEKLKMAIKGNTEYQTKLLDAHDVTSAKTDDIFTNLTVYYADKKQVKKEQAKGLSRREQLLEYIKRTAGFKVKKYEDIFIDMKRENPKLLLLGKPGIGKTFFCEKIIRDWSMNRLFQNEDTPNIKFAYLLEFRQLSSHGDKEINLHELLNCSPLLDDNSVIDDLLFEYMTKNSSEVLIILDGFDECSEQHRKQIASDFEQKYSNNSRAKMPIPALCSKLIRGKVFKNSVVLVTSRQGKAEELRKINVDRYVEISANIPAEIIARGPKALKAYKEALESGSTKNRRLLVMVVGPARAGKTSLLKSFNGEEFDPKEDSTDGIQLQHTFCKPQEKCWGKDGGEGISYTNCIVDVICESLRGENKNLAEASKEAMEKPVESSKSPPKNEDDNDNNDNDDDDDDRDNKDNHNDDDHDNKAKASKDQTISEKSTTNLPKSIEEKLLVKLKDTESDETKENELYIKTLDFAGQAVYNVIHPIFLTLKAVFILVHNLKNILRDPMKSKVENDGSERELVDPFEMTNLEILELWLSCISSYTNAQRMEKVGKLSLPPVFIVGTHADKVDGGLEAAKQIIREIYTSLSPSKHPSGSHVVRNKIYTVDNSVSGDGEIRDESVRILKADIEKLSKSLPHMNEDIPISWLLFEEELSNLVEKENKKYITIDEAMEIAIKCKVNTDAESNEFTTLLNYLHDLKTIIYFEETKTVFIDTQWLVSAFTQVIEVRPVEKRDGFDESWDKLEEEGVLERALVEHVWKGLVDEQNTIYSLLLIMEKFSLICRWNTSEGEEVYLVPCMLCNSRKREDITKLLKDQKTSTIVIRFNIPHVSLGIFPRLFVAIAEEGKKEWPNLRQPKLHKNFCRIHNVGKERNLDICVIQSSIRTISVTVCNKHNIDGKRVIEFCQYFRKLLDQIFDDMRRNFPWMQNMKFHHGIFCPVCTRSPNKCKSHGKEGCTRDSCLHFLNEEELKVDRPECYKDPTNLDNEIEEEAYIYWFPRQARHLQVEKQSQPLEEEFIKEKLDLKSGDKIDDFFGRYEKFALDYQHQVPVSDLEETIRLKHSIGAIIAINISNVPKCGATCFRIGTNYVITNQHVVVEIKDLGIQWSSCYVDFNYGGQGSQPATTFQFNFAPNPELVSSKELDYAILKLNPEGRNLPPSLVDPDSGFNIAPPGRQLQGGECLTFIGHPGGLKKQIDVSCPIKVQQDTQKHLHNDYVFCTIQKAFNHPDIATYDVSTFFKGSSGSPGLLMKEKLLVVLHSGGIPLQGTNKHHVLEYGPLMSSVVKDVMKQINTGTIQGMTYGLDDIFGGSTYSTFNQYP